MDMKVCLIVDDSDAIRKVASRILGTFGYFTIEVATGDDGLKICAVDPPHVILLDWMPGDMDGHAFLAKLRTLALDVVPTVIYATTENDPVDIARALRGGAADFILKPFDRLSLREKLGDIARAA